MGEYAARLKRKLASKARKLPGAGTEQLTGGALASGFKDIPTLIEEGLDPFHAVYVFMQNLTATFAETVGRMPEMKVWARAVENAEDEYVPSGPPISPLTGSYFWMWALYDLKIGKSSDTLASCLLAAKDIVQMNAHQVEVLQQMEDSRMGIFEHVGMSGPYIRLRELVTNRELDCHCPSGYPGSEGELWYVRLLPPVEPDIATFWIAMTTPYVLIAANKADWTAFLRRTMLQSDGSDHATRLANLLKHGLGSNYWNEFVMKAYHHYQHNAIFLAGIPDMQATLPHA
jgi:hypothetical protein